jgi:hypothetical protein
MCLLTSKKINMIKSDDELCCGRMSNEIVVATGK